MAIESQVLAKLEQFGVRSPRAQANALGHIMAESGGKRVAENLRYSPERAFEVFGRKYFSSVDHAAQVLAQGEEAFGNHVYGGRMGNGRDEGYKYRGRGPIQLTGKNNYRAASEALGVDFVGNPDLVNDEKYAPLVAAWFLAKQAGLTEQQMEDIELLGKRVGYRTTTGSFGKRRKAADDYYAALMRGDLRAAQEAQAEANGPFASPPTKGAPPSSTSLWQTLAKALGRLLRALGRG